LSFLSFFLSFLSFLLGSGDTTGAGAGIGGARVWGGGRGRDEASIFSENRGHINYWRVCVTSATSDSRSNKIVIRLQ
jgi:hypothetical protein